MKRQERMGDRTQSWLNALIAGVGDFENGSPSTALFAPILPIEAERQTWYLCALEEDFCHHVSCLALYEIESVAVIPEHSSCLPRLFLGNIKTPHHLLDVIGGGVDVCTLPFVNECTDHGFAFDFTFGSSQWDPDLDESHPLAFNMWSSSYATDWSPLRDHCKCYTCTHHHRAYVQHLLSTNEMLSWVLLQLHNYHVMDAFFEAVRQSIGEGTFEGGKLAFSRRFDRDWPVKTGKGPRWVCTIFLALG